MWREEVGDEHRVRVRFAQHLPKRTQKRDLRKEQTSMRTTSVRKRLSRRNGVLPTLLAAIVLAAMAPGLTPETGYAAAGKVMVVGSAVKVRPTAQPNGTS